MTVAAVAMAIAGTGAAIAQDAGGAGYPQEIRDWRAKAEQNLRRDLGWLTIAGRWELPPGTSTVGSAPGNAIQLPKDLAPAKLGTVRVDPDKVTLALAPGVTMWLEPEPGQRGEAFAERVMTTKGKVDWVTSGRMSLHVVRRDDGKAILRVADRESRNRADFKGRVWYDVDPRLRVEAKFNPYPKGTKIPVANVRGEISEEDAAGNVQFALAGRTYTLDAFADDTDGTLFIILRDGTSGETTYPPGRFLVAPKPVDGRTVVDFNKAYNPPCAFSAYTTCPLPPPQNWMKTKVEAGEKYAKAGK